MGGGYSALVAQKAIDRRSRRAAHVAPIYTSGVHHSQLAPLLHNRHRQLLTPSPNCANVVKNWQGSASCSIKCCQRTKACA